MTRKGSSATSSPSATPTDHGSPGRFICSLCAKVYRSGAGLRYHKRKRHRGMAEPTALHRVKCQEHDCSYQMLAISDLRNHLSNHHHKTEYKCTEEKKFTSVASFTDWKTSFETSTGSKYVKNCGAKGKSDNQTTEYYYCNRTGPFGQGLRRNKAQGSARIGIHCTSSMKVEIQNDGNITVQYYPAHYGHSSLSMPDDHQYSDQNRTTTSTTTTSTTSTSNGANLYHTQDHGQNYHQHSNDRLSSSSSSPGSSSTSPSAGSNSNSNHPSSSSMQMSSSFPNSIVVSSSKPSISSSSFPSTTTYSSQVSSASVSSSTSTSNMNHHGSMRNNLNATLANAMSHCIIITPSLMLEEHSSMHTNDHHTPVFVVQQQLPSTTSANHLPHSTTNCVTKKEKCVSDIMHEAFQLLSYWPLDHLPSTCMNTENEQQIYHSHLNMDEHLMF